MKHRDLAEKILRTLENQRFNDFYNGKFETYLMESGQTVTKEQILEDIIRLFDLKQQFWLKETKKVLRKF